MENIKYGTYKDAITTVFAVIGTIGAVMIFPLALVKILLPKLIVLYVILFFLGYVLNRKNDLSKVLKMVKSFSRYLFAIIFSMLIAGTVHLILNNINKPKPFMVELNHDIILDSIPVSKLTTFFADSLRTNLKIDSIKMIKDQHKWAICTCKDFKIEKGSKKSYPIGLNNINRYKKYKNLCTLLEIIAKSQQANKDFITNIFGNFSGLPIELLFTSGSNVGNYIDSLRLSGSKNIKVICEKFPNYQMDNNCVVWNFKAEKYVICNIFEADINNDGYNDAVLKVSHQFGAQGETMFYIISRKSRKKEFYTI